MFEDAIETNQLSVKNIIMDDNNGCTETHQSLTVAIPEANSSLENASSSVKNTTNQLMAVAVPEANSSVKNIVVIAEASSSNQLMAVKFGDVVFSFQSGATMADLLFGMRLSPSARDCVIQFSQASMIANHKRLSTFMTTYMKRKAKPQSDKYKKVCRQLHFSLPSNGSSSFVISCQKDEANKNGLCLKELPTEESKEINVHFFETWDCWFKSFMSFKSTAVVQEQLDDGVLRCFYKCMSRHCSFATDDANQFEAHLHQNTICCYCLLGFADLVQHMTRAHGASKYQCSGCPYRALSRKHLIFHSHDFHAADYFRIERPIGFVDDDVRRRRDLKHYRCVIDGFSTVLTKVFHDHVQTHHVLFGCNFCAFNASRVSQLLLHYSSEHCMHEFECSYCEYGCEAASQIIRHLCLIHPDRKMALYTRNNNNKLNNVYEFVPNYARNLTCRNPECSFRAWNVTAYTRHISAFHEQRVGVFLPCPHCSKKLRTTSDLEEHIHMHGPNLYRCDRCDFLHWSRLRIQHHLLSVHGLMKCRLVVVRQFQDPCLPPIATLSNCAEEQSDNETSTTGFACCRCDRIIDSKTRLLIHYRRTHSFLEAVCCRHCQEIFFSKRVQLLHEIMIHTDNSMRCFICKYKTNNSSHMKEHLFAEVGYFPFRCTLCEFGSNRKRLVIRHGVKAHGGNCSWIKEVDEHRKVEEWAQAYMTTAHTAYEQNQRFTSDGDYLCVACGEVVKSSKIYRLHLFGHLRYKPEANLKMLRIEEWVSEKVASKRCHLLDASEQPDSKRIRLEKEGFSHYGKEQSPCDLSRLYFYILGPCAVEIRVPVLDGFKYMNLEARINVERI